MRLLCTVALLSVSVSALAQPSSPACPAGTRADYHVHVKGDLSLEEALRRSRESGITYGIAINGGLGFPIESDAGLEAFLLEMRGRPVFKAFQGEGREWVRLFKQDDAGEVRLRVHRRDDVERPATARACGCGSQDEVGTDRGPRALHGHPRRPGPGILATSPSTSMLTRPLPDQLSAEYDRL